MKSRPAVRSMARVVCLSSVCSAALAALAGAASAQSLRPNIMFIFDTSGSMAQSTGTQTVGEGTNVCPAGTTSRIYNLKQALRSALQQVGTDEANFGLMSFPMAVGTTFDGTCTNNGNPRVAPGHYSASPQQTGVTTPNRTVTNNVNGTGTASTFTGGCLMSTNRGNETAFGPWFVNGGGEVLRVGVTTAAGTLQKRKLIRYARGRMEIVNRRGLEAAACACYRIDRATYQRHLGQ